LLLGSGLAEESVEGGGHEWGEEERCLALEPGALRRGWQDRADGGGKLADGGQFAF